MNVPERDYIILPTPNPLRVRSEREKRAVARALRVNARLRASLAPKKKGPR